VVQTTKMILGEMLGNAVTTLHLKHCLSFTEAMVAYAYMLTLLHIHIF